MKFKIYLLALLCICISASAQQKKYTIKGNLSGIKVPVKLFLYFRDGERKVTDSTLAQNGKFTFSGELTYGAEANLYLHPVDPPKAQAGGKEARISEGIQLFLEPGTMLIDGDRLRTATISGGQGQKDFMAYQKKLDMAGDSVYQIWKSQQGALPEDSAAAFKRLIYARGKVTQAAIKNFVKAHPQSEVSFNIAKQNSIVIEEPDYIMSMLDAIRPTFGQSEQFKFLEHRVALTKKLSIGQTAINFTQMDDKGKMVSLSDVKGKYVLIDFWASWCGPCRIEYPYLKKAYAQFKNKNFEIIGISLDDKKDLWLDAIKSNGFDWIELCDLNGRENAVAKAYGIAAIPQSLLIDPQGKIIAKNLRGEDLLVKLTELIH